MNNIDSYFQKLESGFKSKKYKVKKEKSGCLSVLLVITFISFLISFFSWILFSFMDTIAWYSLVAYLIFFTIRKWPRKKFKPDIVLQKELKTQILPILTKEIYPSATFDADKKVSEDHLREADFFELGFFDNQQFLSGEDLIKGSVEGVDFEFSEITNFVESLHKVKFGCLLFFFILIDEIFNIDMTDTVALNVLPDSVFSKTKQNFRGFFLYADFHKDFHGEIIIRSKTKSILDKILLNKKGMVKIIPENKDVDNRYEILASNQQLGYYVLSPVIIEAIDNITRMYGKSLQMKIKEGKLFMILPLEHNYFETYQIKNNIYVLNTKSEIIKELETIKTLIKTLNLDTRIWTKR
ncbi:DUF3137 domain-containing protein [Aquimarina muelleri]|uniref:DUF3137 domain-containing protein n=1 Tax=Aquimarina muelleri TaxID=279356 RepID=UPI003F685A66